MIIVFSTNNSTGMMNNPFKKDIIMNSSKHRGYSLLSLPSFVELKVSSYYCDDTDDAAISQSK
jgi:hypothetical protein